MSATLDMPVVERFDQRRQTIRLTQEQFDQLDRAVSMVSEAQKSVVAISAVTDVEVIGGPCLFSLMICTGPVPLHSKVESGVIQYLEDDQVRLVRPTLNQLLDVRKRAILRP